MNPRPMKLRKEELDREVQLSGYRRGIYLGTEVVGVASGYRKIESTKVGVRHHIQSGNGS